MKKTIANTISEKIKKGEVTMRSQLSIGAEKLGINGSLVILLTVLCTIAGFVLYWINSNSDLLFGGYGQYGVYSFIQSFPYPFVLGFITLFIFLIVIFRRYDFSYKKPLSIILLMMIVGILTIGWFSIKQPMGQRFYQQEGTFLRMGMMNNRNAVSGVITEIKTNTVIIQNENGDNTVVTFSINTHFPFGKPKVGDSIRAVGTWDGDTFVSFGIRVFDENNPSTLGPGMMRGRGQGRGQMWNR